MNTATIEWRNVDIKFGIYRKIRYLTQLGVTSRFIFHPEKLNDATKLTQSPRYMVLGND